MALIKIKEIIGTSPNSFEDAIKEAVKALADQKKNISGLKVIGMTVDIKNGKIVEYKVNLKYAYKWEKKLHK